MKIVLVGDSHSSYHFNDIEELLAVYGHEVVASFDKPGWSAKKYLSSNILDQIESRQPEGAIVALGGNNHDLDEEYGETLTAFLALLRSKGVTGPIVWLGPFEADKETRRDVWDRHEWTSDYQEDFFPPLDVKWIDMRPSSIDGPWRDGVHFSRGEYTRMIDEVRDEIINGLEVSSVSSLVKHPAFWITSGVMLVSFALAGYYFLRK